ncbi:LicD family protein [Clostridium algidicarnis]|uniref:LicD family protein n=1 Tax=Clostridium algidicarnis TaxID=37659 RepID=A0ABS6C5I1_9CLOT|nr:LicD family protein [Clostridium algidicarnis]MBU3220701.1 LicD family protein [Clostridium algidicarnis]
MDNKADNTKDSNLQKAQRRMLEILKDVDKMCRENHISYWLDSGTLLGAARHKGFIPWDDDIDIVMPRADYERFKLIAKEKLPKHLFLQTNYSDLEYDMLWTKVRDNNSEIVEYKIGNYHNGLFIDIFPMDDYTDTDKYLKYKKKFNSTYRTLILVKEPFEKVKSKKIFIKNIIKFFAKVVLFPFTFMEKKKVFDYIYKKRDKYIEKSKGTDTDIIGYSMEVAYWNFYIEKKNIFPLTEIQFEDGIFYAPGNYDAYLTKLFGNYMELPPENERIPHNLELIIKE